MLGENEERKEDGFNEKLDEVKNNSLNNSLHSDRNLQADQPRLRPFKTSKNFISFKDSKNLPQSSPNNKKMYCKKQNKTSQNKVSQFNGKFLILNFIINV